jgi:hypothetical protein
VNCRFQAGVTAPIDTVTANYESLRRGLVNMRFDVLRRKMREIYGVKTMREITLK